MLHCSTYLANHIEDSYDADNVRGVLLAEAHLDGVVSQVDVGHIVPGVEQEVGDSEQRELEVGEVREVQHV